MINANLNTNVTSKEEFLVSGARKVASLGSKILQGVPFAGGVIGALDYIIDGIYTVKKRIELKTKPML